MSNRGSGGGSGRNPEFHSSFVESLYAATGTREELKKLGLADSQSSLEYDLMGAANASSRPSPRSRPGSRKSSLSHGRKDADTVLILENEQEEDNVGKDVEVDIDTDGGDNGGARATKARPKTKPKPKHKSRPSLDPPVTAAAAAALLAEAAAVTGGSGGGNGSVSGGGNGNGSGSGSGSGSGGGGSGSGGGARRGNMRGARTPSNARNLQKRASMRALGKAKKGGKPGNEGGGGGGAGDGGDDAAAVAKEASSSMDDAGATRTYPKPPPPLQPRHHHQQRRPSPSLGSSSPGPHDSGSGLGASQRRRSWLSDLEALYKSGQIDEASYRLIRSDTLETMGDPSSHRTRDPDAPRASDPSPSPHASSSSLRRHSRGRGAGDHDHGEGGLPPASPAPRRSLGHGGKGGSFRHPPETPPHSSSAMRGQSYHHLSASPDSTSAVRGAPLAATAAASAAGLGAGVGAEAAAAPPLPAGLNRGTSHGLDDELVLEQYRIQAQNDAAAIVRRRLGFDPLAQKDKAAKGGAGVAGKGAAVAAGGAVAAGAGGMGGRRGKTDPDDDDGGGDEKGLRNAGSVGDKMDGKPTLAVLSDGRSPKMREGRALPRPRPIRAPPPSPGSLGRRPYRLPPPSHLRPVGRRLTAVESCPSRSSISSSRTDVAAAAERRNDEEAIAGSRERAEGAVVLDVGSIHSSNGAAGGASSMNNGDRMGMMMARGGGGGASSASDALFASELSHVFALGKVKLDEGERVVRCMGCRNGLKVGMGAGLVDCPSCGTVSPGTTVYGESL